MGLSLYDLFLQIIMILKGLLIKLAFIQKANLLLPTGIIHFLHRKQLTRHT